MSASPEIARDIAAQQPVSPNAQLLMLALNVPPERLERKISEQQGIITGELNQLDVMVAMSGVREMDFDPYVHEKVESPKALADFAEEYDEIRRDPVRKHEYDSRFVYDFIRKLGPTNYLRQRDGIDAAFELSTLGHLLEADFRALPASEQRPERRVTEALIAEELALLWAPTIPQKARSLPEHHRALIYNAADPNAFSDKQVAEIPEKDRWKMIGARLAGEAAALFRNIANSPTAPVEQQLEARARVTDMSTRQLGILASAERYKGRKEQLHRKMVALCEEDLTLATGVWSDTDSRREVRAGKLYEFMALAKKRHQVVTATAGGAHNNVRLALPREDSTLFKTFYTRNSEPVNLSVDVVEEDPNGNFVRAWQVKAMTEDAYGELSDRQREERGATHIYPSGRTGMIFMTEEDLGLVGAEWY